MPFSSCCKPVPVALGPLEESSTLTTSYSSSPPPSPTRFRRPRRVLYPAFQSRRPPLREAPDKACRCLLFLSVLVFLQIYTEEPHTCTVIESQCPDPAVCQLEAGDGSLGTSQGWTGEEPWRIQTVDRGSETQVECVVAWWRTKSLNANRVNEKRVKERNSHTDKVKFEYCVEMVSS